MRVAAFTMAYNETIFLPLWAKYYGGQLGLENIFCIDHESTKDQPRVSGLCYVRVPRESLDEEARCNAVSNFQAFLLRFYDAVVFTDTDEFLSPDPRKYLGIADYIASYKGLFATSVGINVVHERAEPPIDTRKPILSQRSFVRFQSDYCKPAISRVPLAWTVGFHACQYSPAVDPYLKLFHLKAMDLEIFRKDHEKRKGIPWSRSAVEQGHGAQWRAEPAVFEDMLFSLDMNSMTDDWQFAADLGNLPTEPGTFRSYQGSVAKIPSVYKHIIAGVDHPDVGRRSSLLDRPTFESEKPSW